MSIKKGTIVVRVKRQESEEFDWSCPPPRIPSNVKLGDIVVVQRRRVVKNVPDKFSQVDQLNYDTYTGVVVKVYDEGRKFYLKSVDKDFIVKDSDKPAWSRYGNGIYVDSCRNDMYHRITVVDRATVLKYTSSTLRTIAYEDITSKWGGLHTYSTEESAIILKIENPIYFDKSMTYAIHNNYGDGTEGTSRESLVKSMNLVRIKYLQSLV